MAGLLGRNILENFEISVPVLVLTGGLILFLVVLGTVLEQSLPQARLKQEPISPGTDLALSPLAFPIIATPYGIAAVIVFATLAQDTSAKLTIASIVLVILLLDWLAMLFCGFDPEMDRDGAPGSDRRARSDPNRVWAA